LGLLLYAGLGLALGLEDRGLGLDFAGLVFVTSLPNYFFISSMVYIDSFLTNQLVKEF